MPTFARHSPKLFSSRKSSATGAPVVMIGLSEVMASWKTAPKLRRRTCLRASGERGNHILARDTRRPTQ